MEKTEITQKSDREILIHVAIQQNAVIDMLCEHHRWIHGNGKPGAKTQLYILWTAWAGLLTAVLTIALK